MKDRRLLLLLVIAVSCCLWLSGRAEAEDRAGRPINVLLITADDMNCDSVGAYGCKVPETTPNIDRLAAQGMRFAHAHVTIAVCQPCRGVWATGRYPHRSGIEGFQRMTADHPTLMQTLQDAGYRTGILGKVGHSTPKTSFQWDMHHDMGELGKGRDPRRYYAYAKGFFEKSKTSNKPFYLMANSHDPHRPFAGSDQEAAMRRRGKLVDPSRIYRDEEVDVPGFLPDIPKVRKEIAEYFSSVRRCDDTVGALLKALDESGLKQNTLVMFLSDHGMALPFAKTNCYLHSTRTPWIVRWPGVVEAGRVDGRHFVSGVDLMPTLLDAAGVRLPEGMDGRSFVPILNGKQQEGREFVFTQFHQTAARRRYPMRCIQTKQYGYIFNPWADGKRVFLNESQSGRSFSAMKEAAKTDRAIAARVKLFQYRVVEEFYDFEKDPDATRNLIGDPACRSAVDRLHGELARWMQATGDPALEAFRGRESPASLGKFMSEQDGKARPKRPKRKKRTKK